MNLLYTINDFAQAQEDRAHWIKILRDMQDPETFITDSQDGFFASEIREASGHTGDLYYLLILQ